MLICTLWRCQPAGPPATDLTTTLIQSATLAAVAAATFVAAYQARVLTRQMRITTATARATIYQGIAQEMLQIDRFFVENPVLRPYFYEGQLPPTYDRYLRRQLESASEMLVDFADNVYLQARNLHTQTTYPGEAQLWDQWALYFHDLHTHSDVLRQFVETRETWLKPGLVTMFRTGVFPTTSSQQGS